MISKRAAVWVVSLLFLAPVLWAQGGKGKIVGTVIDEYNAMTLPFCPVGVVGSETTVFTELDGKFSLELDAESISSRIRLPLPVRFTVGRNVERAIAGS